MNYYISDLHYGHNHIIKFDNRPFENVEEMEEKLVNNWNSVVTNKDHVYHLGDFCWGKIDEWIRILKRLNGNIHIIKGNHDIDLRPELKKYIVEYTEYKELKDQGYSLILCHYPILFYKHSYDFNTFMLCGHVHKTLESEQLQRLIKLLRNESINPYDNKGQIINVGCMMPWMNYTPQTLKYLVKKYDNMETF